MSINNWILSRLKEPSTYAGFSVIAMSFGLSGDEWSAISTTLAALAGLAAVFLSEAPKA
jgi:hypothetical protein